MSGFGVYVLGSTVLGAINSALGLGLGFSAFTGLSSLIATATGPVGWTALGVFTLLKLGSPNYKRVLPAVIYIAAQRGLLQSQLARVEPKPILTSAPELLSLGKADSSPSYSLPRFPKPIGIGQDERRPVVTQNSHKSIPNLHKSIEEVEASIASLIARSKSAKVTPALMSGVAERDHGTSDVALDGVFKQEEGTDSIAALRLDLENATASFKKEDSLPSRIKSSKQDRIIFDLVAENRVLTELVKEFGFANHFLDLSEKDQATIRNLAAESLAVIQAKNPENVDCPQITVKQVATERGQKRKGRRDDKRKEYRTILQNLEFTDLALDRLLEYMDESKEVYYDFLRNLRELDRGAFHAKYDVPSTSPRLWQKDAGRGGRIYFRRDGPSVKAHVALVGTKHTQRDDYARLQANGLCT